MLLALRDRHKLRYKKLLMLQFTDWDWFNARWGQDRRTSSRPKQDTCGRCGSVSFKVKSTSRPGGNKKKVDIMPKWSTPKSLRNRMFPSKPISKPCLRHFSICQPDSWLEYLSSLRCNSLTSFTIPRSRTGQPRCGTWLAASEFKDSNWQRFEKRKTPFRALWVQMLHVC